MRLRVVFNFVLVIASVWAFHVTAVAQSSTSAETPGIGTNEAWDLARQASSSHSKLFVVTVASPQNRQRCRVQSFSVDKLVCARGIGGTRTYLPQQILALILPGDREEKFWIVAGINVGLGAAIWGTVALAATCPACAAATAVAAVLLFAAGGAILIGDEQPERLLYLAPGQDLPHRFHNVQR